MSGKVFVLIFFLHIMFLPNFVLATESDIENFLESAKSYSNEAFPGLIDENTIDKIVKGDEIDGKGIISSLENIFVGEIKNVISLSTKIICACILCGILKNLQCKGNFNASEAAFYVCYLVVATLIIEAYVEIANVCETSMNKMSGFMNMVLPLIFSLLLANGGLLSTAIMQPVLMIMTNLTNTLITKLILPVIFISMVFVVVGNISENIQVKKLPELLQKISMWIVNLMLGIFIGILSLEGTLSANVDGFTAKTTKTVVSTVIPVVGKALSDATDSVIGAVSITKNAIGIVGVLTIAAIIIIPIVKISVITILFSLMGALMEPIVDKRMSACICTAGKTMKILLALLCTVSVVFIISITLMIKVRKLYVDV